MKKILVIAYEFPPIRASNDRTYHFCRYLPQFGWNPIVVAPRKPSPWLPPFDLSLSIPSEIEVHDAPAMRGFGFLAKNKFLRVYLNSLFFFLSSYNAGGKILEREKDSVKFILASIPTAMCLLAAYRLSKKFGVPLLLDFRDPHYPSRLYKKHYFQALQHARQIITTTEVYKQELVRQGAPGDKISVIPNGTDFSLIEKLRREKPANKPSIFTVIYAGGYFKIYRVDTFIKSLAMHFKDQAIKFVIVGKPDEGQEGLVAFTQEHGLLNVEFKGRLSQEDTIKELLSASVAYNGSSHPGGLGGKMYDYLACGLPILGYNPWDSSTHSFITKYNVGLTTDKEDQLTQNLEFLYKNPSAVERFRNTGLNIVKKFDRKHLAKTLAEAMDRLI